MKLLKSLSPWVALALLGACTGGGTAPAPGASGQPGAQGQASAAPSFGPVVQRQYRVGLGQQVMSKGGLWLQALPDGGVVFAHQHPRTNTDQEVNLSAVSRVDAQGKALWSRGWKGWYRVYSLRVQGDGIYLLGTVPQDPEYRASLPVEFKYLHDVAIARFGLDGSLKWTRHFRLPRPLRQGSMDLDLFALGEQGVAMHHQGRLFFLSPEGDLGAGLDFTGAVHAVLPRPEGGLWVTHDHIEAGYTWRHQGFQISALGPGPERRLVWHKTYAKDLNGIFTPSKLHPVGDGQVRMAFGLNDLQYKNPLGIGHLLLSPTGAVVEAFTAKTSIRGGASLLFTSIGTSWATEDAIHYATTQTNGKGGDVLTGVLRYNLKGEINGFRDGPGVEGGSVGRRFYQPRDATRLLSSFAFQLAINDFDQDLCRATTVVVDREDGLQVQVLDQGAVPTPVAAPSPMGEGPTMTEALSLLDSAVDCQ